MIDKDFVTYQLALKLNTAGYPQEDCMYMFDDVKQRCHHNWFNIIRDKSRAICACPSLYEAQEWLRRRGIDVLPRRVCKTNATGDLVKVYQAVITWDDDTVEVLKPCSDYQESLVCGIDYVIEKYITCNGKKI